VGGRGEPIGEDRVGRNLEAGRAWDNNSPKYSYRPGGFTSVMTTIVNKAAVVRDFGNEGLSVGRGGSRRWKFWAKPTKGPKRWIGK